MKIDPLSLKLFIAVVETGTIAAAADREHTVPSALSRRISELEERLGTALLIRSNKGVKPTVAGTALMSRVRIILNEFDQLHTYIKESSEGLSAQIRISANIAAITQLLPMQLASYIQKYPNVQILLREEVSENIIKAVAENSADIGIFTMGAHSPLQDTALEIIPYRTDELVVVTPVGHPLAGRKKVDFQDTLGYDYIGLHSGLSNQLIANASRLGATVKFRIQVNSYDTLCRMVQAGLGISILPLGCARPYSKTLRLKVLRLLDPWKQEQAICVRSIESLPMAAQSLVLHLKNAKDLLADAYAVKNRGRGHKASRRP